MAKVICAVYDSKAETYGMPLFFRTVGEAIRSFADECNRDGSLVAAHPADFTLMRIGTYDEETGELIQEASYANLANGVEYSGKELKLANG